MGGKGRLPPDEELFLIESLGRSTSARQAAESADQMVGRLQQERGRTSFVRKVLRPARRDEKNWARGARGERIAAHALSQLPTGWWVLHDLQVGSRGANIDHLVVGPGGIFTINTKNLSSNVWVGGSTFMVGGTKTDYVRKAEWEAERVGRLLTTATGGPLLAYPVVAVLAPRITIKTPPKDVAVISVKRLTSWLRAQPIRLNPAAVIEVVAKSDNQLTWQPKAASGGATPASPPPGEPQRQAIDLSELPPPPPVTQVQQPPPISEPTAPEPPSSAGPCICGGTFVLRHRRSDGRPFYGCSTFPRCRQTRQLR